MSDTLDIKIKYHYSADQTINRIIKNNKGDWIDLYCAKDTFIPYMEMKLITLGVSIKLPEGYEAHLLPRSSTFKKWGIIMANNIGIIDNSYSGDNDIWQFAAISLLKEGSFIKSGDRICQFRIVKSMPNINLIEVDHLDTIDRGGFGSTGYN